MAEITRRRTGELLRELFNILMAAPEGVQASAALHGLAGRVTLTPYEADSYDSGGRRFEEIVRCVVGWWCSGVALQRRRNGVAAALRRMTPMCRLPPRR